MKTYLIYTIIERSSILFFSAVYSTSVSWFYQICSSMPSTTRPCSRNPWQSQEAGSSSVAVVSCHLLSSFRIYCEYKTRAVTNHTLSHKNRFYETSSSYLDTYIIDITIHICRITSLSFRGVTSTRLKTG